MSKTESFSENRKMRGSLREAVSPGASQSASSFRCVLISEGLGNFGSCFYYTKEALQSGIEIFEGKKIYADHPDAIEEEARPERSVEDILGHWENLAVEESDDGRMVLVGDVVTVKGNRFDWARALMQHQIEYAKKYPDVDFIGISINACGDADEVPIDSVLSDPSTPEACKPKLMQAKEMGIEIVRKTNQFSDAVSGDLVTEAGAGGRVVQMIERAVKMAKKESKAAAKTGKVQKQGADGADGANADHADKDQDVELIKSMLKKHMGDGSESDDKNQEALKSCAEAYMEQGMSKEEAYEAAGKHMKAALAMSKKKEGGDAEKKDDKKDSSGDAAKSDGDMDGDDSEETEEADESEESDDDKNKESAETLKTVDDLRESLIKANARIAALESKKSKETIDALIERKFSESKLPRKVTAKGKELIESLQKMGALKTAAQVEKSIDKWIESVKADDSVVEGEDAFDFGSEKHGGEDTTTDSTVGSGFGDCVKED